MPKVRKTKKAPRRAPLVKELMDGPGVLRPMRDDGAADGAGDGSDDGGRGGAAQHLPPDLSRRILREAHAQQADVAAEAQRSGGGGGGRRTSEAVARSHARMVRISAGGAGRDDEDDEEDDDDLVDLDPDGAVEDVELDAEDEAALAAFMPQSAPKRRTLADMILDRIAESKAGGAGGAGGSRGDEAGELMESRLDPRVVQVYTEVGRFLSHYKSGKMPKAFKIIPSLKNWEEVMLLTRPHAWTPHSVYAATRIFASNLNQKAAQRFYGLVLLPRVQDDIDRNRKLNFHLYQSLRKALYKPAAFFKGVFLPMAGEGCTLREAVIVSSVVAKASVPALHSSVALLKLLEIEYSGATCLFTKTLLEKKYSLPYRVVDALVRHFCAFAADDRTLPVMWHRNFLIFVQRYKNDLSAGQRRALRELINVKSHHLITPEIRRELQAVEVAQAAAPAPPGAGELDFSAAAASAARHPASAAAAGSSGPQAMQF